MNVKIFVGSVIHCVNRSLLTRYELEIIDGFVLVRGRKILATGSLNALDNTKLRLNVVDDEIDVIRLKSTQILIPGLIDTHIHAPQYPNCGLGYDKTLLDWLNEYTYKLERRYDDLEFSARVFDAVVRRTLDQGTTTACYFASLFNSSSMVLVDAVLKHGQRAFVGKVNMTTLAPDDYVESPEETIDNTLAFIDDVRSKMDDLVQPIVTPRFALSVDMRDMRKLAKIAEDNKLNIQSHISETLEEVEMVKTTYETSYSDVYDKAGLLTNRTVMAHGVHLTDDELSLLAKRQTSIAHCPESNTCLKSGLCDVRRLWSFGVTVGLGTDVSGGPSPSIVSAMRAALATSIHLSFQDDNVTPLNYQDVFYMATLGGAEALSLTAVTGNFEDGKDFDAVVVDMNAPHCSIDYSVDWSPLEILQKFVYTGDDRNVVNVYVAGKEVKRIS